jgi:hypothetical protein
MFQLTSGMTVESCTIACLANSFVFTGIGGFDLFFRIVDQDPVKVMNGSQIVPVT